MNKTVELVNEWAAFEEKHPDGTIDDFCRYHLIHQREDVKNVPAKPGLLPVTAGSVLMRLLGRIVRLHAIYAVAALDGTGLHQVEEFALLNTIKHLDAPRKTEVIYSCLQELSTGTDMLNRLKKNDFFTETDDVEDKRSKRLKLTEKGAQTVMKCHARVKALAEMMMHDLSEEDRQLCIQLLKRVDDKFSRMWQGHKGKGFEEIYKDVAG